MTTIKRLADTSPDWIELSKRTAAKLVFEANPPSRSGVPGKQIYDLVAEVRKGELTVSEASPGTSLPSLCVERHINPGSTFCLFMDSETPPQSNDEARYWWHGLRAYLQHQQYAVRFGRWPLEAQMSHGHAALVQQQMEQVADKHNWRSEVLASIFRKKGWLGEVLPRLSKDRATLVNARSPCPRGCKRKHHPFRKQACKRSDCLPRCEKSHPPLLRVDCPQRRDVEQLVMWENSRRGIESRMIERLKKDGHRCCGTMKECALRAVQGEAS